jgi:hypothetical protein
MDAGSGPEEAMQKERGPCVAESNTESFEKRTEYLSNRMDGRLLS